MKYDDWIRVVGTSISLNIHCYFVQGSEHLLVLYKTHSKSLKTPSPADYNLFLPLTVLVSDIRPVLTLTLLLALSSLDHLYCLPPWHKPAFQLPYVRRSCSPTGPRLEGNSQEAWSLRHTQEAAVSVATTSYRTLLSLCWSLCPLMRHISKHLGS